MMIKFLCDYCGGYEVEGEGNQPTQTNIFMSINWFETKREICARCYVKVFDIVLGQPKATAPEGTPLPSVDLGPGSLAIVDKSSLDKPQNQ